MAKHIKISEMEYNDAICGFVPYVWSCKFEIVSTCSARIAGKDSAIKSHASTYSQVRETLDIKCNPCALRQ